MNKTIIFLIKLKLIFIILIIPTITGCTYGRLDTDKLLSNLRVAKSDEYKNREGWKAVTLLGKDDCKVYKSGGKSFFKWEEKYCTSDEMIKKINKNEALIPIFYTFYHEYGNNDLGTLSFEENNELKSSLEMLNMMKRFIKLLNYPKRVDAIYFDFKDDYWNMGLNKVSKIDFKKHIDAFLAKSNEFIAKSQKKIDFLQKKRDEEIEKLKEEEHEAYIRSDTPIEIYLWSDPTKEQKYIIDALKSINFSIRNDNFIYANGRRFIARTGMESFVSGLDISLQLCSDNAAYVGNASVKKLCAKRIAEDIILWGILAKDKSITDNAWNRAAFDSMISYSPLKSEILFSHWIGQARVYSSRGI